MHVYHTTWFPEHHRAWADGRVYTHILAAEKKIGRELKDGEVVHHIDKNKLNNDPDNLMVFRSDNDHKSFHAGNKACIGEDGAWFCEKNIVFICENCNKSFALAKGRKIRNHIYCCHKCAYEARKKITVSVETIISDIYNENGNLSKVGRKYGITSNAIVKLLKKNGYPYHAKDYKKQKK